GRIVLAHAIHRNLLHDDVMTAHGRDHVLLLEARTRDERAHGLRHEDGVHDLTLDDRIGHERTRRHLDDLRLGLRVIDNDELHDAASDAEARRQLAPAQQSHYTAPARIMKRGDARTGWRTIVLRTRA